mmetsp:Transcript_12860/g.15084  ORF Transcript_12860/g.15084 Transcript_12860/m.15084 type:complete len:220 (-) Transcript_12860:1259-1918(-)
MITMVMVRRGRRGYRCHGNSQATHDMYSPLKVRITCFLLTISPSYLAGCSTCYCCWGTVTRSVLSGGAVCAAGTCWFSRDGIGQSTKVQGCRRRGSRCSSSTGCYRGGGVRWGGIRYRGECLRTCSIKFTQSCRVGGAFTVSSGNEGSVGVLIIWDGNSGRMGCGVVTVASIIGQIICIIDLCGTIALIGGVFRGRIENSCPSFSIRLLLVTKVFFPSV